MPDVKFSIIKGFLNSNNLRFCQKIYIYFSQFIAVSRSFGVTFMEDFFLWFIHYFLLRGDYYLFHRMFSVRGMCQINTNTCLKYYFTLYCFKPPYLSRKGVRKNMSSALYIIYLIMY